MPLDDRSQAQPVPAEDRRNPLDKLVDTWHADYFPGSAAARDVDVWNLIHKATQDLKQRLAAFSEV